MNNLQSLTELRHFHQVANAGSFSLAAKQLGQTSAAVSAGVKRLEEQLQVRLFERSTRSVRLTQAGEQFLVSVERILNELEQAQAQLKNDKHLLEGVIRLSAPSDLARTWLNYHINAFKKLYPQTYFNISVSDKFSNLQKESIDLAIRFGQPKDSSLIARHLAQTKRVAVAAPSYIEKFGYPESPYQLKDHNCLCYEVNAMVDTKWTFYKGQQAFAVEVNPDWVSDDCSLARQWAIEGKGIVYKSQIDVADDINHGRLQPVLTEYQGQDSPLYLVYPSKENQPKRVRAFIDYLLTKANESD